MKIRTIKIGATCTDLATKLKGTITHWKINLGKQIGYLFQPSGLDPEDGQPVHAVYLEAERLQFSKTEETDVYEEVEVPFEILGTKVTHTASGFTGTATAFVQHPHGCFHVYIQPEGRLPKNNGPIKEGNFALTACTGEVIKPMTKEERKAEETRRPSPSSEDPFGGMGGI